jgi:nucleotide-binding universal stress UspA family protein
MFTTLLVPVDGSELAERALPHALALADSSGARLLLLRSAFGHVRPGGDPARVRLAALAEAEGYLEELAARLRTPTRTIDTVAHYGDAADAIADEVTDKQVGLIVMSTHGRSGFGRWLFGSVADAVLRHATVPVLLIPPTCARVWGHGGARRIVVPLDGSPLAETALEPAVTFARHFDAALALVRVIATPYEPLAVEAAAYTPVDDEAELAEARAYLETLAAPLRAAGLAVTARAEVGIPATSIATAATEEDAMLIALATHGRGGVGRLVLGSVATGTIQRSEVPLLLVRPAGLERAGTRAVPGDARTAILLTGEELSIVERGLRMLLAADYPAEPVRALLARLHAATPELPLAR